MLTTWLNPSRLSNVLGLCDPAPQLQRNFELLANHFDTALAPVAGPGIDLNADAAAAAVQANFTLLAAATGLDLYPVADAADPEVCCQANFEMLNAIW